MHQLDYTAITTRGTAFDIGFPLHPETGAPEQVGEMLTAVLGAISGQLDAGATLSDGDVLQSLAMAVAIRARIADAEPAVGARLAHELIDQAFAAAFEAQPYPSSRA